MMSHAFLSVVCLILLHLLLSSSPPLLHFRFFFSALFIGLFIVGTLYMLAVWVPRAV
jgi:ABC-type tungstate transport system substrate-binding protein